MSSYFSKKSTLSISKTVGDTPNPVVLNKVPFHEANFHIYDYDVYYGDGTNMGAIAQAGSVLSFDKGDLSDFFFKNRTAGNNGRVELMATVVHPETNRQLQAVD